MSARQTEVDDDDGRGNGQFVCTEMLDVFSPMTAGVIFFVGYPGFNYDKEHISEKLLYVRPSWDSTVGGDAAEPSCLSVIPTSTIIKNTFPTHHSIISQC
ncbi:hypothetical protein CDV36_015737 [Fusarium kuroshium]|uniref:Uncharacterized protein n=1 Tax=Fusarium kuroshium TaxID=2010991 RepID=A0A3M2R8D4_9HYPO|nr:hypothetical protein CDV36_015737 [Fusarium kuroshium]